VTVGQPQLAAGGPVSPVVNPAAALTEAGLAPIVQQAEQHLADLGVPVDASLLNFLNFHVTSLQNGILGITWQHDIWIDQGAAGYGWYIGSNSAFGPSSIGQDRLAGVGSAAVGKMDLETVVEHELAHVLGFASGDAAILPNNLMTATLAAGVRRTENFAAGLPSPPTPVPASGERGEAVDAVFGGEVPVGETVNQASGGWVAEGRAAGRQGANVFAGAAWAGILSDEYSVLGSIQPGAPALLSDPSALVTPIAAPDTADDLLPAVLQQGPSPRQVLIGGSGDDIVIFDADGGACIGGIGNGIPTAAATLSELADA
jgi:hypothetical protein